MSPAPAPPAEGQPNDELGSWSKGVNNVADETKVDRDELRAAVNMDISVDGQPRTRVGRVKVFSGSFMHSLWADDDFDYMLAVDDNTLKAFDGGLNAIDIRAGLKPAQDLSYTQIEGEAFWSNGFDCGKVRFGAVDAPWGVQAAPGVPNAAVLTGQGGLAAGTYQVAVVFRTSTGEQGGSTLALELDVPEGGGIALSAIPQPFGDNRINVVRVYRTEANDGVLKRARDLPTGLTSCVLGAGDWMDTELQYGEQWARPMPAGQIVRGFAGRLYVASDNVLLRSLPAWPGQYVPSDTYATFSGYIRLMEPVGENAESGGIFVCAGARTYYISGDPANPLRRTCHPYGAVPGTGLSVPLSMFGKGDGYCAFWLDAAGRVCLGKVGGTVEIPNDVFLAPLAEGGSAIVRDINGIRQVLVSLRGTGYNQARASDSVTAVVNKNAVVA